MAPTNELTGRIRRIDRLLVDMYGPQKLIPRDDPLSELVHIILTQNTSDANSDRAYAQLRRAFPTWDAVLEADAAKVAGAIRVGGLADIKAARIQDILRRIKERHGSLDLGFLKDMDRGQAVEYLCSYRGVGHKTAACVLLFSLKIPVFPVDTHVHRVSRRLALVPEGADAVRTHEILDAAVPDELKYQFHVNTVVHGRRTCRARNPRCEVCLLRDECLYHARAVAEKDMGKDTG